ncbi:putative cytochrome P450 [Erysiphe neolycopersici]|uniref:Putative cytochrome P450 n=1 Tax=Erysiphe neolycopersici TaxID=212602 RepID=A0A420HSD0_9PEZI|nr:putative cytochrome P450 [Erysiphe neolycopersici]
MSCIIVTVITFGFLLLYRIINTLQRKNQVKKPWQELLNTSTLEMRAGPNKRLELIFGIKNSFTTSNLEFHKSFLMFTIKKLEVISKSDWKEIRDDALEQIKKKKHQSRVSETLKLSSLVQNLKFRIILRQFFPSAPSPRDDTIEKLTAKINSMWMKSKNFKGETLERLQTEKKEILCLLSEILSEKVEEGSKNPLNIIIPAYETLWRVVLLCFLETVFRTSTDERSVYNKIAEKFMQNPSLNTLNEKNIESINMGMIVKETLRLYPPTRRIYRLLNGIKECVNVESLHRDPEFFGPNENRFQPRRWKGEEKRILEQYLPFGYGKFKCPARNNVAPMMIAVLSSALIVEMGEEYSILQDLGQDPLPSERNSFDDMNLNVSRFKKSKSVI